MSPVAARSGSRRGRAGRSGRISGSPCAAARARQWLTPVAQPREEETASGRAYVVPGRIRGQGVGPETGPAGGIDRADTAADVPKTIEILGLADTEGVSRRCAFGSGFPSARVETLRVGVRVGAVIYLAAFAPVSQPESRAYYDRKRREGKHHIAALIALARRRIDVLFAMLRDGTFYEPPTPTTA